MSDCSVVNGRFRCCRGAGGGGVCTCMCTRGRGARGGGSVGEVGGGGGAGALAEINWTKHTMTPPVQKPIPSL